MAALYRFAPVADPEMMRAGLDQQCRRRGVRGTLLVAREGLNGTIAGTADGVAAVIDGIRGMRGFADIDVKYSRATTMPFHRLKVRIKPEIVTMGQPGLDPVRDAGVYVSGHEWNALIRDPDTIVIDTRNDYEGAIGAFEGAVQPNTRTFRDFPAWFHAEGRALLDQPNPPRVAMYCTGGIRCEKATAFLKAEGVTEVHHLEGGILRYLEEVPEAESLWRGECFVFDQRVAVGHGLSEGSHTLCHGCRMPVDAKGRASPHHVEGVSCPACHDVRSASQRQGASERQRQVGLADRRGVDHIGAVFDPKT